MENYKELYENEKRLRLHSESSMKEIMNKLWMTAYTISEDSKMQLLKNDLQRIQQEIQRLETTKQERLQQHFMSIGGAIHQSAVGLNSAIGAIGMNASSTALQQQQQQKQLAMLNVARAAAAVQQQKQQQLAANIFASNVNNALNASNSPANGAVFQKPRAPRRKRNATEEVLRPSSALPPASGGGRRGSAKASSSARPMSAMPPAVVPPPAMAAAGDAFSQQQQPVGDNGERQQIATPLPSVGEMQISANKGGGEATAPKVLDDSSQLEDDVVMMTETIVAPHSADNKKKEPFFCEYCSTATVDEASTIAHIWRHVNEIRRMHAFECVVADCGYKTNVTKDALYHKKTAHTGDSEECKILDRRDNLADYFKHCIHKYFVNLDEVTKEKIFEARYR